MLRDTYYIRKPVLSFKALTYIGGHNPLVDCQASDTIPSNVLCRVTWCPGENN